MPASAAAPIHPDPPSSDRAIGNLIGTPRTKHVTTNVIVEVDEEAGTAAARSYVTVFQARPGLALQAIMSGRYQDRFERRDGHWRFAERRVRIDLTGDLSGHLRQARH
jgi:3-phenylpropionate/cinnamic acid dioxygenase small subunit